MNGVLLIFSRLIANKGPSEQFKAKRFTLFFHRTRDTRVIIRCFFLLGEFVGRGEVGAILLRYILHLYFDSGRSDLTCPLLIANICNVARTPQQQHQHQVLRVC